MLTFSGCLPTWQRACWLQADTWNCQQFYADPSQGFATRWRQFNGSSASIVSLGRHTGKTGHCCTRWARFSRVLHTVKPNCPRVWMSRVLLCVLNYSSRYSMRRCIAVYNNEIIVFCYIIKHCADFLFRANWLTFDRPEVTLCGWQDVKVQLLTNYWTVP